MRKAGNLSETTSVPLVRGVDWWKSPSRAAQPCLPRGIDTISGTLWAHLNWLAQSYYDDWKGIIAPCLSSKLDFSDTIPFNDLHHTIYLLKLNAFSGTTLVLALTGCHFASCATNIMLHGQQFTVWGLWSPQDWFPLFGTLGSTSSSIKSIWYQTYDHTQAQVLTPVNGYCGL